MYGCLYVLFDGLLLLLTFVLLCFIIIFILPFFCQILMSLYIELSRLIYILNYTSGLF